MSSSNIFYCEWYNANAIGISFCPDSCVFLFLSKSPVFDVRPCPAKWSKYEAVSCHSLSHVWGWKCLPFLILHSILPDTDRSHFEWRTMPENKRNTNPCKVYHVSVFSISVLRHLAFISIHNCSVGKLLSAAKDQNMRNDPLSLIEI